MGNDINKFRSSDINKFRSGDINKFGSSDINKFGSSDIKIFFGIIVLTAVLVIGFAFSQGTEESTADENNQSQVQIADIQISPETYKLGNVPINGGLISREYEVKNETTQTAKLQKIVTSCMCTKAKVSLNGKESRFFGMEHPGDRNPPINFEIPPGETAKIIVEFNPAAHGPQGVGPFNRAVRLTFSKPSGIKELTFDGTVIR